MSRGGTLEVLSICPERGPSIAARPGLLWRCLPGQIIDNSELSTEQRQAWHEVGGAVRVGSATTVGSSGSVWTSKQRGSPSEDPHAPHS